MKEIQTLGTIILVIMVFISPIFASEYSIWGLFFYGYFFILFLLTASPWAILFEGGMDKETLIFTTVGTIIWGIPGLFSSPDTILLNKIFLILGGVGITLNGLIYIIKPQ